MSAELSFIKPYLKIPVSVGSPTSIYSLLEFIETEASQQATKQLKANESEGLIDLFWASKNFWTVILFSVRVPVLSEQMILVEPSVSTAGNPL
ncbi:hypothetical protein NW064_04560 [Mycoplasmopsis felis]|nr:hypothetical protein NW064_04560 [Mycoplasmopsis felis]